MKLLNMEAVNWGVYAILLERFKEQLLELAVFSYTNSIKLELNTLVSK